MLNLDPFNWWAVSISGGIVFLILVSIYLYVNSSAKRKEDEIAVSKRFRFWKDFAFVWLLISLLFFYIMSVNIGSALVFALGNIIVESILLIYLARNRQERAKQKQQPRSTLVR